MVDAAPFRALRYDPLIAGDPASTSAPAYDDLERFTYARHRTASPYTVLELLAEGADADYRPAAAAFSRWRRTGVMVEDAAPAFYLYDIHELRGGVPTLLRGVLAAVSVNDPDLLAHERVDAKRVAARARRLAVVPVDLAPVFAVHIGAPAKLRETLDRPPRSGPVVAVTDEVGADHRVWRIDDESAVNAITDGLRDVRAVIADGHHRHAAARLVSDQAAAGGGVSRILTYLVDAAVHGPQLRAVHRLVRSDPAALLAALAADFTFQPVAREDLGPAVEASRDTVFGFAGGDVTGVLTPRDILALRRRLPEDASDAWRALDTAIWEAVVRPLVHGDVEYRSDLDVAAAEAGAAGGALFVLRAPSMTQVEACAAAGEAMPVKTTWFRPKPRAGLVMRSLD